MKENLIQIKSFKFALRIIKLKDYLVDSKREYSLSDQILRSGTSIGANVEEAIVSQSKKEFISKLNISYKESRETLYWLKLLRESNKIEKKLVESLIFDCDELCKLLCSIIKSTNHNAK